MASWAGRPPAPSLLPACNPLLIQLRHLVSPQHGHRRTLAKGRTYNLHCPVLLPPATHGEFNLNELKFNPPSLSPSGHV